MTTAEVATPVDSNVLLDVIQRWCDRRCPGQPPTWPAAFFIETHAAVLEMRLLTRDPTRYPPYFPTIEAYRADDRPLGSSRPDTLSPYRHKENEQQ